MRKFKICREDIYVGELVDPGKLYRYTEEQHNYYNAKVDDLYVHSYRPYRSMLFTPNEEKLAQDLLYKSPNYPILNISDDSDCLNSKIVIQNPINLGKLLKHLGFKEKLTQRQLWFVRQLLFHGRFVEQNPELWKAEGSEFEYSMLRMLDEMGNNSILSVINGLEEKANAFKPDKKEGKIRRLSLF